MLIDRDALDALYLGAFAFYLDHCQFLFPDKVVVFCDRLVVDFDKLSAKQQERIKLKLRAAWAKELDYGKNSMLSPFGKNQKAWYKVVKKVLNVKV